MELGFPFIVKYGLCSDGVENYRGSELCSRSVVHVTTYVFFWKLWADLVAEINFKKGCS
jgi:hypothetical protein